MSYSEVTSRRKKNAILVTYDPDTKYWGYENGRFRILELLGAGSYNLVFEVVKMKDGTTRILRIGAADDCVDQVREDVMSDMAMQNDFGPWIEDVSINELGGEFAKWLHQQVLKLRIREQIDIETRLRPSDSITLTVMQKYDKTLFDFMTRWHVAPRQHYSELPRFIESPKVLTRFIRDLDRMHSSHIVHSDLKSDNIMCTLTGNGTRIARLHIIDFGLAMFNDRLAEPRFRDDEVMMRVNHMDRIIFRNTPLGSLIPATNEEIIEDITRLDSWLIDFLEVLEETGESPDEQFSGVFEKRPRIRIPLPIKPEPPRAKAPFRPSHNWQFAGQSLAVLFPIYKDPTLYDAERQPLREKIYKIISLKLHPDKFLVPKKKKLDALKQECAEQRKKGEQDNALCIEQDIAAKESAFQHLEEILIAIFEAVKQSVKKQSVLLDVQAAPENMDRVYFSVLYAELMQQITGINESLTQ